MILQCPACQARYTVPDHAIGAGGRTVKCAKCAHQWHVSSPTDRLSEAAFNALLNNDETANAKPSTKDSPRPAAPVHLVTMPRIAGLAAGSLLAIITSLLALTPSMLGFSPTTDIAFAEVKFAQQQVENGVEYGISGKMVNLSDEIKSTPNIKKALCCVYGRQKAIPKWRHSRRKSSTLHRCRPA